MHLPFPQDLHDFVWLEARDFRPALFTGQGQESSQFAASTLRRKFQRQHTSRQALRVSGRTLAKTRAQRKLALPRVAQPQRPLASEVFFTTDYAVLQRQFPDIGGRDGGAVKLLQVLACCQGTAETLNYRGTLVGDHADYVRGGEDDVRSEDDDIIDDQSDGCLDDY